MLSNKWTSGSATNFGRWDYPLGVTMYGLLQTSRILKRPDIAKFAHAHIDICTSWYEYAVWDRDTYGFPSINHQLVLIKMLDNCGSFGSAMLEAYTESGNPDYLNVAEVIADFMTNRLERREDGAFYRLCISEYSADTMWADDLYMSTPFLSRYAEITGDSSYLDDAAHQFMRYREYLFMPEEGVMSHVFDFKYGKATNSWGRGNGWSLFSLSEPLERLPGSIRTDRPCLDSTVSYVPGSLPTRESQGSGDKSLPIRKHMRKHPVQPCSPMPLPEACGSAGWRIPHRSPMPPFGHGRG